MPLLFFFVGNKTWCNSDSFSNASSLWRQMFYETNSTHLV